MPTNTNVSGYNSTSNKLIVQVGDELKHYRFTTPFSFPAPVITASDPTDNSIELRWADDSLEMQFVIQQRLAGASAWTDIQNTAANVTGWTATGLQEGSTYEFRVRASNTDYSSPWSNIATATTSVRPPVPVIIASDPTYNSIELSWTFDSLGMQFVIQQRFAGANTWTDIQTTAANVTRLTVTDLQEGLTYEFRVRAISPDYSSPWSNIASATTSILLQTPVIIASNPTHDSIELSWTYDSLEIQFVIQQRLASASTWAYIQPTTGIVALLEDSTYEFRISALNLQEGSTYEFRVCAITPNDSTHWSNIVSATTLTQEGDSDSSACFISSTFF